MINNTLLKVWVKKYGENSAVLLHFNKVEGNNRYFRFTAPM